MTTAKVSLSWKTDGDERDYPERRWGFAAIVVPEQTFLQTGLGVELEWEKLMTAANSLDKVCTRFVRVRQLAKNYSVQVAAVWMNRGACFICVAQLSSPLTQSAESSLDQTVVFQSHDTVCQCRGGAV